MGDKDKEKALGKIAAFSFVALFAVIILWVVALATSPSLKGGGSSASSAKSSKNDNNSSALASSASSSANYSQNSGRASTYFDNSKIAVILSYNAASISLNQRMSISAKTWGLVGFSTIGVLYTSSDSSSVAIGSSTRSDGTDEEPPDLPCYFVCEKAFSGFVTITAYAYRYDNYSVMYNVYDTCVLSFGG